MHAGLRKTPPALLAATEFLVVAFSATSRACDVSTSAVDATPQQVRQFFEGQKKQVLTFVGYSGAGYEDRAGMLNTASELLDEFAPAGVIVNIGATPDGIGAIYALAKQKGFTTTGIVSTKAKEYDAAVADCVDHVFYVRDATWGGFIDGKDTLPPTSTAMVENSDYLVAIGGGTVARDELIAAQRLGKKVRFVPADMNHQKARDKAKKKNLPAPTDFSGAAGGAL